MGAAHAILIEEKSALELALAAKATRLAAEVKRAQATRAQLSMMEGELVAQQVRFVLEREREVCVCVYVCVRDTHTTEPNRRRVCCTTGAIHVRICI